MGFVIYALDVISSVSVVPSAFEKKYLYKYQEQTSYAFMMWVSYLGMYCRGGFRILESG